MPDLGREYGIFGAPCKKNSSPLTLVRGARQDLGGYRALMLFTSVGIRIFFKSLQKVLSTFLVSACLVFVHSRGLLLPRAELAPSSCRWMCRCSPAQLSCVSTAESPRLAQSPFPSTNPLHPLSQGWEKSSCCLVGCGCSDPQGNIWCPRVANGAERHRAPCSEKL